MSLQVSIEHRLRVLAPSVAQVENESHRHNVPAGSESHFKVTVVSARFEGESLLARHRIVNELLSEELKSLHALALHTLTPDEWDARQSVADSPPCLGGSARETTNS